MPQDINAPSMISSLIIRLQYLELIKHVLFASNSSTTDKIDIMLAD